MKSWMVLTILGVVILGVTLLWLRERRSGKRVDFDIHRSRGQADDEFRTREGPGGHFGGGAF
jgi:hypothetical protein